jgi:hypothetical protein
VANEARFISNRERTTFTMPRRRRAGSSVRKAGQRNQAIDTHVVGRSDCDAVFKWMPAHMQNLLVEVDLVCVRLLAHSLSGTHCASRWAVGSATRLLVARRTRRRVHWRWDANLLGLEGRLVRLQNNFGVLLRVRGVDHEVVVVAASHDILGVARKDDFELVEDAVILVRIAESRSKVLVNRNGLDGSAFHVDVPYLDCQIVS